MYDTNIRKPAPDVKGDSSLYGPFRNAHEAANAAKSNPDCRRIGAFVVIKGPSGYTYAIGEHPALFSFDIPIYRYYFLNNRVWSYPIDARSKA